MEQLLLLHHICKVMFSIELRESYPDAIELLKIVLVHHYVLDIWLDGLFNIGLVCTFLLSSLQVTSSGCYVWASQIVSAASW